MIDVTPGESFQAGIGKCVFPEEPMTNKKVNSCFKGPQVWKYSKPIHKLLGGSEVLEQDER